MSHAVGTIFRTQEPNLADLLRDIGNGKIQLPDFQRGWVWDDSHIRSLIASISLAYPIGAVMLLDTGPGVRFKARPVEGATIPAGVGADRLILDGQQRMTSLFMSMYSGAPVPTRNEKGKDIERVYYFNIPACLDPEADREDAVVSMPTDRMLKSDFNRVIDFDLSTRDKEFAEHHVPAATLLDNQKWFDWAAGYREHFQYAEEARRLDVFDAQIRQRILSYRIPTIELGAETEKEAVCNVFEKVNTGGVSLTVFELMTATFAADDFDLREDWEARKDALAQSAVLKGVKGTDFLQAVTLMSTYKRSIGTGSAVGAKRKDILKLSLENYRLHADKVMDGFRKAAKFLASQKIFDGRNIPYSTQLIPLSVLCGLLGTRTEVGTVIDKLAKWYWCGVFGELYGGSTESRFVYDVVDVIKWIDGDDAPRTVRDASFDPVRLLGLQSRQSAAYKGIAAALMRQGGRDWVSGVSVEVSTFFDEAVDIHHVFPRSYCQKQGFERRKWNSVVNKAPLTARTNRMFGGKAPSEYLERFAKDQIGELGLEASVDSHCINIRHLESDDFDGFIIDRATRLLDVIEQAMGKPVAGRSSEAVVQEFGGALVALPGGSASEVSEGRVQRRSEVELPDDATELFERLLGADLCTVDQLRLDVRAYLAYAKVRARTNPEMDIDVAEEIADDFLVLLDLFEEGPNDDETLHRHLQAGIHYFSSDDDAISDHAPGGFDDDAAVLDAVTRLFGVE